MKIDAGSHGVFESLPRLVDPASGSAYLRLVPHFLSRLHPPALRGDFVPCGGDPRSPYEFPLLKGANPVDVSLRGSMTQAEVSAGLIFENAGSQWSRSWWRWIAHALSPFGWVSATPQFIRKQTPERGSEHLLASLGLMPSCGGSPEEHYRVAEEWLVRELGTPHHTEDRDLRRWRYEWGSVGLYYEIRDGLAEVGVLWEPFSSELDAEIREQLRSLGHRPEAPQ